MRLCLAKVSQRHGTESVTTTILTWSTLNLSIDTNNMCFAEILFDTKSVRDLTCYSFYLFCQTFLTPGANDDDTNSTIYIFLSLNTRVMVSKQKNLKVF